MSNLGTADTHSVYAPVCAHTHTSQQGRKVTRMLTCSHDRKAVVSRSVSLVSPCQVPMSAPGGHARLQSDQTRTSSQFLRMSGTPQLSLDSKAISYPWGFAKLCPLGLGFLVVGFVSGPSSNFHLLVPVGAPSPF